ncbi:MAG: hypothetical protein VX519_12275 [Myxococcota bacterium]|nr:hypothetical protein [Myxococcota bacterium]
MSFYLLTLSIIPLYVSRAFLPIFATALFARWGAGLNLGWLGFFEDFTGIGLLDTIPAWAIEDQVLVVLGVLAGLEFLLQRIPEARILVQGVSDSIIKAVGAGCTSYLLVGGDLSGLLDIWIESGDITEFDWSRGLQYTWSFGIGLVVFSLSSIRGSLYAFLQEADPEDDLGLQGLLAWLEDAISFVGIFVAFIMPAITAMAALVAVLLVWALKRALTTIQNRQMVACHQCDNKLPACAPHCGYCGVPRPDPSAVGWMGWIQSESTTDTTEHHYKLLEGHRCHHCGTRLAKRGVLHSCEQCQTPVFATESDFTTYLNRVQQRLTRTLVVCALWSLFPVFGLVPGLIYYRLSLVHGLKAYTPQSRNLIVRLLRRVFVVVLLLFQWVPGLGLFSLPLICLLDYRMSRKALLSQPLPAA